MNAPQPMPPKGPPQAQASPPDSKNPKQLVVDIHDDLAALMQIVQSSGGAVSPQERQILGQIIQMFQGFVDGLSQPQGQAPQGAPQRGPAGPVAPEAGGNPNARPV